MSEQSEQQTNVIEFPDLVMPVVEYGVSDAAIAELTERFKSPDASTDDGYEHCKDGCRELSALRTGVETRRLNLKRPVTDWIRTHIDGRGKELIRKIRKIEAPVRTEKGRVDEIKQAEARKAAEAEQARIDGIKDNIEKIAATAREQNPNDTAADYQQHIAWLTELVMDEEVFGEFVDDAKTERDAALFKLGQWHEQAEKREAEQAKIKADQARLDKEREELEADQKKQREAEAKLEKEKRETAERKAATEKAAQEKKDREELEAAKKERERIDRISVLMGVIRELPTMCEGLSADGIAIAIAKALEKAPDESTFQEFLSEAKAALRESIATLTTMAKDASEREEKARRDEEARLPDQDKLQRWCDEIDAIPEPEVLNEKAQKIIKRYGGDLSKFVERLRSDIGKL